MKQIGNLIELDPTKNYIVLVDLAVGDNDEFVESIRLENGNIYIVDGLENIKFVEKEGDFKEIAIVKGE